MLQMVNDLRTKGTNCGGEMMPPVASVEMDAALLCAARLHSKDMAERDFFSHSTWNEGAETCASDGNCATGYSCDPQFPGETPKRCGKSPALRVEEAGGPSGAGWENIAGGKATAEATFEQWVASEGHCKNMMRGQLKTIGIGYYSGGSFGHYWTQSFND